jgi:hypothetical protein
MSNDTQAGLCAECARGYHINHESGGWVNDPRDFEVRELVGGCTECSCEWR